jgi:hypothetical protein
MVHRVNRAPEVEPQALVLNDTLSGEAIEPPGDVDEFTFAGSEGQEVSGFLRTLSGNLLNVLRLCVVADAGTLDELELGCVNSAGDDVLLWEQSTGRLALPRTTTYTARVLAPQSALDWGRYQLMVHLVNRAPEAESPELVLNDTISGEAIEPPGDVDEFLFAGTEGQEVAAFLQTLAGDLLNVLRLCVVADPGTQDELEVGCVSSDGNDASLWGQSTGRLVLPRTTTYAARILGVQSANDWRRYRFTVHDVDRAPEEIATAIAVGDTVSGESIEPPGDVDEFTFTASAAQTVEVFFQALSGGYLERLGLELIAYPGTSAEGRLGSLVYSDGGDTSLEGQSTGVVTLPYTGTYVVRAFGADSRTGLGGYRFHVRP